MINLINKKFIKSITCDKPQRNNYELDNLLDYENSNKEVDLGFFSSSKSKHFSVDTFVRAPVNVQIAFSEPMHIEAIYVESKVNSQISNGFLLSTSFKQTQNGNYMYQDIAKIVNESNKAICSYEFKKRNSTYDLDDACHDNNERSSSIKKERMLIYFKTCPNVYLDKAIALNISIIKTLNSTSPCLSSLKVYGHPSRVDYENTQLNRVDMLFSSSSSRHSTKKAAEDTNLEFVEIPNEFLDEITNEMMRMPIKLPSEKYVDKTTLDTYLLEQNKSNTQAKDPFTRVPFSSSYKPTIDEALKARIDKFVLDKQKFSFSKPQNAANSANLMKLAEERARISNKRCYEDAASINEKNELELNFNRELSKKIKTEPFSTSNIKCNCCLNSKNNRLTFYEITTCKHVYCKNCLFSICKVCPICKRAFENSQVINFDRHYLNKL
jgi:hypothetical protein